MTCTGWLIVLSHDSLLSVMSFQHCYVYTFSFVMISVDGVVLNKDCIVIPSSLRLEALYALYAAHGVTSMIARAEQSVCWSDICPAITAL